MVTLTDKNFDEAIKGDLPLLVDFYTDWCGPCKMMTPVIADLAVEFKDRAVIAKINADENPVVSEAMQIRGVPTFFIFKNGQLVSKNSGFIPKVKLKEWLEEHLI